MKTKLFNYSVIIKADKRTGTNEPCFSAFCPRLGLADSGDTIEEAKENMKRLILFHLECLTKENSKIAHNQIAKNNLTATVQIPHPC